MRRIIIIALSAIVVIGLFMVLCTFKVRPYEIVLLDRFGTVVENPTRIAYGWCLCYPTDRVVRQDKRLHIYQTNLEEMQMSGDPISVRTFAAWQIEPKNSALYYKRFKGNEDLAENQLSTQLLGATNAVMSHHHMDEIFNAQGTPATNSATTMVAARGQTDEIEKEIMDKVNADMSKAELGMQVAEVGFSRLAFPNMATQVIYGRMATERQGKAQVSINEGNTESTRIRADADSRYDITVNAAKREAESIKAKADQEALETIASMQQTPEARELYSWWKSLEIFKVGVNKGTVLILTADDPLMRFLRAPGSAPITPPAGAPTRP